MDKGFHLRIFLFGYPRLEVANSDLFEPLSECEVDVLRLSAEGFSNQKIGERLFISFHTVKSHPRNLFARLHAAAEPWL